MGLEKDTRCQWFGTTARLDEIFDPAGSWRYLTDPATGKRIKYQVKTLNLVHHGRCKVFAIRRGNDRRIRYYATNRLKTSLQRLLPHLKGHWRVETMHRDLKEYFGLGDCCSGLEPFNVLHWELVYLTYLLFCGYQRDLHRKGLSISLYRLLLHYHFSYDFYRARHCFFSPKSVERMKRLVVAE